MSGCEVTLHSEQQRGGGWGTIHYCGSLKLMLVFRLPDCRLPCEFMFIVSSSFSHSIHCKLSLRMPEPGAPPTDFVHQIDILPPFTFYIRSSSKPNASLPSTPRTEFDERHSFEVRRPSRTGSGRPQWRRRTEVVHGRQTTPQKSNFCCEDNTVLCVPYSTYHF